MIKVPYYFVTGYSGSVGYIHPDNSNVLCGYSSHLDERSQLVWLGRKSSDYESTNFKGFPITHFSSYNVAINEMWVNLDFKSSSPGCLFLEGNQVQNMTENDKVNIKKMMLLEVDLDDVNK